MGKQVGENSLDHSYPSGFGNSLYGFTEPLNKNYELIPRVIVYSDWSV